MEVWAQIRRRVKSGELSMRAACSEYGLNFRTVKKIVQQTEPSTFQLDTPRDKPVLGPFIPIIQQILQEDRLAPAKQRHSGRRIFERLRDEHGYKGGVSVVRDAIRQFKQSQAEVFVPLVHPPGEAQVDFGHAEVIVANVRHKAALFVMTLPHSNARFGCLFPKECTETFQVGHALAFDFFGGVARRISYDNSKIAVAKIIGPHQRQHASEFLRLQSHFGFESFFCRVRKPQEKGHVENGVGYVRRNHLVPLPQGNSWTSLNDALAAKCRQDFQRPTAKGQSTAILLAEDRAAFGSLPAEPFEAQRVELATINSLSLGRFDGNDYSVPTRYAYKMATVRGSIDRVRFLIEGKVVAEHARCWEKKQVRFEPLHYLSLLEKKPGALDYAKPLAGWSLPEEFATLRQRLEEKDPIGGTKQYVGVLRLLEKYELAAVQAAIQRALKLAVVDASSVRLLLQSASEEMAKDADLSSWPKLQQVSVPSVDLKEYEALTTTKEVEK